MGSAIIAVTKAIVFIVVAVSAIVAFYAAESAMAVYTNLDTFRAGVLLVFAGVLAGPLFCFIAGYGMVDRLGVPTWTAVLVIGPAFLAWSAAAARTLYGVATR